MESAASKRTTKRTRPSRASSRARPGALVGFRAELSGVSLWDLVQMECLAGSRMVVLVTGEAGIGYLYFDRGHIVHAVTTELAGQQAALEILGLDQRFVPAV